MDHVVIRIGQLEHVYGTVESTRGGRLRYESDTAEKLDVLVDLIAEYLDLQDPWDGARYRELPAAEYLRRLARRCNGCSPYALWAEIVEDSLYPEPGAGAH
jgi:hypothetical protein